MLSCITGDPARCRSLSAIAGPDDSYSVILLLIAEQMEMFDEQDLFKRDFHQDQTLLSDKEQNEKNEHGHSQTSL